MARDMTGRTKDVWWAIISTDLYICHPCRDGLMIHLRNDDNIPPLPTRQQKAVAYRNGACVVCGKQKHGDVR